VDEFKEEAIFQKAVRLKSRNLNFSKTDKTNGDVTYIGWMVEFNQPSF
jgi:hypothetical protein